MIESREQDVIVVGAGVAGLAAAMALTADGCRVTLLERRGFVGGRAYSYPHPALGEVVDSQHVLLGCCTNLIELCDQAGLSRKIRWYDKQTFLEPGDDRRAARASTIAISALPAPFEYAGSFLRASMLGLRDKIAVARGLMGFLRGEVGRDDESVADWYRRTGQTHRAVRHFWEPIVLATLNDTGDNCSMKYASKVFYEIFLKTRDGGKLGIPTVPLSEFYGAAAQTVKAGGGTVEMRAGVESLAQREDGRWAVRTGDRELVATDVILALPFEQTRTLLGGMSLVRAEDEGRRARVMGEAGRFVHSPFISILVWFDRVITELDHAWLLDTTIQWFFHKSVIRGTGERGSYVEVVIAGSKREVGMSREEILGPALAELARFFPQVGRATVLKSGILKEARATFSVTPGLDEFRPQQDTGIPGLFLAGDWTRTDWPSTMEGAARSGRLAAGAVRGDVGRFMAADLAATGLMKWFRREA